MSFNLGFIVGPALAGILGSTPYGEMLPVIAAAFLSLIAIFAIFFFLPESKPKAYSGDSKKTGVNKILGIQYKDCYEKKAGDSEKVTLKKILSIKFVTYFIFLNFLIFLGFNFFYTAFPVYAVQGLGWSLSEMGIFFSILSLIMIIVQGPVLGYASKKFSEKALILFGSFVLGTNFILLLSESIIVLYTAAILFAFGNGLMWPSFLSVLSKAAGSKYQGSVQGYANSAGSLASIVGLIAGGILYESIGAYTFLISAAVIYVVFVLSFRIPEAESLENSAK
jgi:MFS family permease